MKGKINKLPNIDTSKYNIDESGNVLRDRRMTEEELEKKAIEYRIELVPYTELGYPDVEIPVYSALQISEAYIAGAKEMQLKQKLEEMKCCHSCQSHKLNDLKNCQTCDGNYSNWELAE